MKTYITLWTLLLFLSADPVGGQTLVSKGSAWKYLDDGTDLGTSWKGPGFDDSDWKSSPEAFKAGIIDEKTIHTTFSYGPETSNNYATIYLRSYFDYLPSGDETGLLFSALIDDGAIVYLNGEEVFRMNIPDGQVYYDTYALSRRDKSGYIDVFIPIEDIEDVLSEKNLIAVELHQANSGKPEIGWDLELSATTQLIDNICCIRFGSTGDPLHGLTISWKSNGTADSIAWGYTPSLESGVFEGIRSTSIIGTQFDYTFPGMTPGSTIHYTIFDSKDSVWTDERTFQTASDPSGDRFSFTTFGDSRTYHDEWKTISGATLDTDFTLFLGDIVNDGRVVSDWEAWFDHGEEFISREAIYHSVGNHDDDNSASGFDNFLGLYTLPGNELYYSFNYGNAVFICLNTERAYDAEQYAWLLSTLEANKDQIWKFVFFHRPFYTAPDHTGEMNAHFNTLWKAFDDYGVDMIFNGHTHNYQRTKPINRNISTTTPVPFYGSGAGHGRCQIVAGSAGAPMHGVAPSGLWWLEKSASLRHFCNVEVDGDRLSMKAMDANHVVFDSLVIDKSNSEITFQVDISKATDLYDGGAVWLVFGEWDSSYVMTDADGDGVYTCKITVAIGTDLKYFYSYQTGADPGTDKAEEIVPAECGDAEGYRMLEVSYGNFILPAVLYGSCDVMVSGIAVSAADGATVAFVGDTLQMVAAIEPGEATDTTVTWSVDDPSVAAIDAVTGLLIADKIGVVKVTATANDGSGVTGTFDVTVVAFSEIISTAYYPLDDNLNDAGGKDLHATDEGTTQVGFVTDDVRGKVAHFVEGAHAFLPYSTELAIGTGDFSVAFWVKSINNPVPDGDPAIFTNKNWDSGSNPGLLIALDGADALGGKHMLTVNFSDGAGSRLDWDADDNGSPNIATDGLWHHIAVTLDRDATMKVYIDNVLYQTDPDQDSRDMTLCPGIGDDVANQYPWAIFQCPTGTYNHDMEGWMDDLYLFKGKVLSALEVAILFKAPTAIKDIETGSTLNFKVYSTGNTMQIEYNLEQASSVALDVYNMLGARVGAVNFANKASGTHTAQFDASGLAGGIYVFKLNTSYGSAVVKAVK